MSRQIETGTLVVDSFPVFEDDGYTTKSGLLEADFDATVYFDGVALALPVSIVEIGSTGQYKLEFTPSVDGYYQVQIAIDYNLDIWTEAYESAAGISGAVLAAIKAQVDKIDLVPTLGPAVVTSGSLMDRIMNKDSGKTYNQSHDSLEALRDRTG